MLEAVFSSVAKFLNAGWKVGGALAIFGGLVWLTHAYDVPPIRDLPREWYQGVSLIALLGLGLLGMELLVLAVRGVGLLASETWRLGRAPIIRRRAEQEALANLDGAKPIELRCLLWMRLRDQQRFRSGYYDVLESLSEARLLEMDHGMSDGAYWRVPDHVWKRLDRPEYEMERRFVRKFPVAKPPWVRSRG